MRFAIFYIIGFVLGIACYVLGFNQGVLTSIEILFYRGVALAFICVVLHWLLLFALRRFFPSVGLKDIFVITALTLSFNLTFLIVFPVTIDRSVTVFLLGHMGQNQNKVYTKDELKEALKQIYIDDFDAVSRRMNEQILSENIEAVNGGFRLTAQGVTFLEFSRMVSKMLGTESKFIEPRPLK